MPRLKTIGFIGILAALLTAACSGSSSSLNPTSPTAVVAGALNSEVTDGSAVSGATGGPKDKSNKPVTPGPPTNTSPGNPTAPTNPVTGKVEIEGMIASIAGSSITVNGQTVLVPASAEIRHGSRAVLFSELQVGDRVHVKATMQDAVLQATEVKVQNPEGDDDVNDDGAATVRVAVLDAAASETASDTGAFRLTRVASATLPITAPQTVTFTLTGTALNGVDYQSLSLTTTFLAGQATVDVVVTPLADLLVEGPETVILTLTNAAPYALGSPVSGTVTITEMPAVTVMAFDASASEIGPDTGTFRFTRNGSTALTLTVTYTVAGTAVNGTDYQGVPLAVTFLAGQATADVVITPMADAVAEGVETVILTVTDGALYDLGAPNSATVTIAG